MNQIQIMRDVPVVTYDGRDYRITGHPSHLFRLLILNNGKTVTKSLIASLHDTDPKMAASKIRYLNRQLGGCPELIENDRPTGYRFAPDGWVVDATEFCTAIQTLDGTFEMREDRPVDPAAAKAEVKAMERVLGYWSANPGAEIPGNWEEIHPAQEQGRGPSPKGPPVHEGP